MFYSCLKLKQIVQKHQRVVLSFCVMRRYLFVIRLYYIHHIFRKHGNVALPSSE